MRLREEKGLTLAEVLGAMVILSIVVLGVVQISHYAAANSRKADLRAEAQWIAENELALLRADDETLKLIPFPATKAEGRYTIYYEKSTLPANSEAAVHVNTVAIAQSQKLSLQSVILFEDNVPYLVTVTVGWEES